MASKVSVECPGCFAKLNLPDRSKLGKKIKCPKCAEVFVAEAPDEDDEDDYEDDLVEEDDAPARSSGGRKRAAAGGKKGSGKGSASGGNNTLLIIGAVAGLVLLVGGGLFFAGVFGGGNQPLPAPPGANAAPAANVAPVASHAPVAHAAPAPKPATVAAAPAISAAEKTLALRWMPSDTELLIHLKVAEVWQAPLLKPLLEGPQAESFVKEFQKNMGMPPTDVESLTFGVADLSGAVLRSKAAGGASPSRPQGFGPPGLGANPLAALRPEDLRFVTVLRSKKPVDLNAITQTIPNVKMQESGGKRYFEVAAPNPQTPGIMGWSPDGNTFVIGTSKDIQATMSKGETNTPRKEFASLDHTPHLLLASIVKEAKPEDLPAGIELPAGLAEMQEAFKQYAVQAGSIGLSIKGGFDLSISAQSANADGTKKLKTDLEAHLAEGKQQFEAIKATAPPLLGELGEMLLNNLKIEEQGNTLKVATSVPDSAQQKLEQLPPVLMMMAMTGGLGGAGGPSPFGPPGGAKANITLTPGAGNFSPGSFGEMMQPGETAAVDSVKAEGLPEGVTLTAKSSWSAFPNFSTDGKQTHPVEIMLDLKGEGIKSICAFGNVSAKTMTLEGGGSLKIAKKEMFGQSDPTKSLVPFDAEEQFSFDHPEGTLRVKFSVDPPTGMATKMAALEGTFKFVTAEKSDEFTIEDAPKKALRPLQDPELKAAGVKLLLSKGSQFGGESLTLSCGKATFLGKAVASAPDDPMGATMFFNAEIDKGQPVQKLQAFDQSGKFPEKLQVKFKLHRDVKEQTVSFRFENVPLPSPESKPKIETGTQQQN